MKNIIICALVGMSFLTSGFWVGLRFAPMPKKPAPAPLVSAVPAKPAREAFSVDTLKAASENMLSVTDALKAREASVAGREKNVRQQEEEIVAERGALDRLHAHFRELYGQFQQRLQLVSDTEQAQLARQVEIFNSMDPAQVADMMRALDDGTVVRMFSIMEAKPLSKLVAAWKTKYPNDSARLLIAMNGMGRVVAENKIILPISPSPVASAAAPDPNAAAPSDGTAPATAPDANATPAPDATSPPDASQSSAAPPADSSANTPPSSADPNAPASTSTDTTAAPVPTSTPDATSPSAPAAPPAPASPDSPAAPAAAPDATTPATPTQDSTPPPPAPASSTPSTATSDSTAPLDTPGETAAKADATTRNAPDSAETTEPSEFTPPPATLRPAHDKPVRFASARNN